jgi:hypothetical protein
LNALLVTVAGIVGVILILVLFVRSKIRAVSRQAFGTPDIAQGLRAYQAAEEGRPRSLSNMTRIYEPMIARDFPDFNLKEFIMLAENMLLSVFNAIEAQDVLLIMNASDSLRDRVINQIRDLHSKGETEFYDDVKIHETALNRYENADGRCVVTLQSSVEYRYYVHAGGRLVRGDSVYRRQVRYNTEIIYIQDAKLVSNAINDNAIGVSCPSCGAPIKALGQKVCEYCGRGIVEINLKSWSINRFDLVR